MKPSASVPLFALFMK